MPRKGYSAAPRGSTTVVMRKEDVFIIIHLQTSAVGFNDMARSVQAKAIMPVANLAERFAAPILGRGCKPLFWLM